jgi:hypothetical protein
MRRVEQGRVLRAPPLCGIVWIVEPAHRPAPREPRRASGSLSQALLWIGESLTRVARRCAVHSTAKGPSFFMPGAMATRGPLETAAGGPRGART